MGKRIEFKSLQDVRNYAGFRFRHDEPFSKLSAAEKAYRNVYGMQQSFASLLQFKLMLADHIKTVKLDATRERIYQFFLDRIVT
jgi:hypothetical protein